MSAKEVELQRLNNGKLLLEQRLDEVLKQKEREQTVSRCLKNDWLYDFFVWIFRIYLKLS